MRSGVLLFASLLIAVPLAAQDETHAVITLERTNALRRAPSTRYGSRRSARTTR